MENEFQPETLQYIRESDIEHRKSLGQYFTPQSIRQKLLEKLPKKKNPTVVDPGCGTGEFLLTAKEYFENGQLYARKCSQMENNKDERGHMGVCFGRLGAQEQA